jgi:hypothetical protein
VIDNGNGTYTWMVKNDSLATTVDGSVWECATNSIAPNTPDTVITLPMNDQFGYPGNKTLTPQAT